MGHFVPPSTVKGASIVDKKISIEGNMEIPLSDHYGVEVDFTIKLSKTFSISFLTESFLRRDNYGKI